MCDDSVIEVVSICRVFDHRPSTSSSSPRRLWSRSKRRYGKMPLRMGGPFAYACILEAMNLQSHRFANVSQAGKELQSCSSVQQCILPDFSGFCGNMLLLWNPLSAACRRCHTQTELMCTGVMQHDAAWCGYGANQDSWWSLEVMDVHPHISQPFYRNMLRVVGGCWLVWRLLKIMGGMSHLLQDETATHQHEGCHWQPLFCCVVFPWSDRSYIFGKHQKNTNSNLLKALIKPCCWSFFPIFPRQFVLFGWALCCAMGPDVERQLRDLCAEVSPKFRAVRQLVRVPWLPSGGVGAHSLRWVSMGAKW